MKYKKIKKAKFINRPNRFIANVIIDGREERVHVRNTGRCKELLLEGADLILEDCSHIPERKTSYSLISVYKDDLLINMDSQIPNNVVYEAIKNGKIEEIGLVDKLKKEVTYGNSRFDLAFEKSGIPYFLEIKGVTLEKDGIAQFPDAPTSRGVKHVYEMIDSLKDGYKGIIFFLIQMKGPHLFRLQWKRDKEFAEAINLAHEKGIEILVYDSIVTEDSIEIGSRVNFDLKK